MRQDWLPKEAHCEDRSSRNFLTSTMASCAMHGELRGRCSSSLRRHNPSGSRDLFGIDLDQGELQSVFSESFAAPYQSEHRYRTLSKLHPMRSLALKNTS